MGHPDQTPSISSSSSSSYQLYPQALQLKLYRAFIFSVPVLFSIILFLLFYLFYLKRRRSNNSSSSSSPSSTTTTLTTRISNQPTSLLSLTLELGLKEELKEELQIIIFDEDLKAKDSQCCVCLGEFEMKEELHQISACKHVFHIECIHHWLRANMTCPLCRCFISPTPKPDLEAASIPPSILNSQAHGFQIDNAGINMIMIESMNGASIIEDSTSQRYQD